MSRSFGKGFRVRMGNETNRGSDDLRRRYPSTTTLFITRLGYSTDSDFPCRCWHLKRLPDYSIEHSMAYGSGDSTTGRLVDSQSSFGTRWMVFRISQWFLSRYRRYFNGFDGS